ncbi:MAG: DUF2442 domain-containing protein [Anaerolineales bacterium]|nr:DUF2442 domain-containing protein [Anaerolineales bacterium]
MNQIVFVAPLEKYLIEIEFDDGFRKIVDIRPFIGDGISADLLDEAYFRQVSLEEGGGICWPNGYDFCPNFLREDVPAQVVVTA